MKKTTIVNLLLVISWMLSIYDVKTFFDAPNDGSGSILLLYSFPILIIALGIIAAYIIMPIYNFSSKKVNNKQDISLKLFIFEVIILFLINSFIFKIFN